MCAYGFFHSTLRGLIPSPDPQRMYVEGAPAKLRVNTRAYDGPVDHLSICSSSISGKGRYGEECGGESEARHELDELWAAGNFA